MVRFYVRTVMAKPAGASSLQSVLYSGMGTSKGLAEFDQTLCFREIRHLHSEHTIGAPQTCYLNLAVIHVWRSFSALREPSELEKFLPIVAYPGGSVM